MRQNCFNNTFAVSTAARIFTTQEIINTHWSRTRSDWRKWRWMFGMERIRWRWNGTSQLHWGWEQTGRCVTIRNIRRTRAGFMKRGTADHRRAITFWMEIWSIPHKYFFGEFTSQNQLWFWNSGNSFNEQFTRNVLEPPFWWVQFRLPPNHSFNPVDIGVDSAKSAAVTKSWSHTECLW
jgi:hypothetical protein